jgi:protein-L-isoaspartate(D-aspartate) O-methyltransferase
VPDGLKSRLAKDGILIAPVGPQEGIQVLTRIQRTANGFAAEELLEVRFVPALKGIARHL